MIDIHTHILPMVDDGPATIEESIEMCRIAVKDGIKQIIATPHIYKGFYNTGENDILDKINMLNQILQEEGLDLKIFPGGEVHINNQILNAKALKDSSIFTINGNKKYILLEFPIQWVPMEAEQVIFSLRTMGFTPILPHLERNLRIQANPNILRRFVKLGAILQVTAQSVIGNFGAMTKKCVLWMLKKNFVQVIASDAHSAVERPPILSGAVKIVSDMLSEESARRMVFEHPKMIVEGTPFVE